MFKICGSNEGGSYSVTRPIQDCGTGLWWACWGAQADGEVGSCSATAARKMGISSERHTETLYGRWGMSTGVRPVVKDKQKWNNVTEDTLGINH